MLATSTATFKAGPSRKKKPAAGSRTSSRDPPPSGAWKPLAQTPHRRLHQTRRDARARHMRGRPDRTPQARDTARLAISRRSSPNLRSQNSSPALGKSTMSDRLHHHHVAISPPLQPRRKHGTDARVASSSPAPSTTRTRQCVGLFCHASRPSTPLPFRPSRLGVHARRRPRGIAWCPMLGKV